MSDLTEPNPISADRRRAHKRAQLPEGAVCLLCGVSNVDSLRLLEAHHVLGQAASNDVVPLCRNCHAIQTGLQHDHQAVPPPGRYTSPDHSVETVARALRSLALFLHELAHTLQSFAQVLFDHVAALDARLPGWREGGAPA